MPLPDHGVLPLLADGTDRLAVSAGGRRLTYAGLYDRAARLAGHLQALGVGREALVAICLERSVDMVVAVLGVLWAEGAYVPVDPGYPAARQRLMLEDSGAGVVVTEAHLRGELPLEGRQVVLIDRDWPEIAIREPLERPAGDPSQLAYVIYTSGSTGRPKGVEITHGGLVNLLLGMRERPGLAADAILAAVTTLSFDISVADVFLPLACGASSVIAEAGQTVDGAALAALLRRTGATDMQATPLTWRLLLDGGWTPPSGFRALCGGEALPPDLAARLLAAGATLWNLYGPTETTVWSTCTEICAGDPITLGEPIGETTVHLLDEAMAPVPPETPGRIFIGGAGVARGYRGRPDLTAERFQPDTSGPGRIYDTGDIGRVRADGRLEYLGRADHQIKLRGLRIELGEIEATLAAHPDVAGAVVTADGAEGDERRLVAYLVPAPGRRPEDADLRAHLATTLPEWMRPGTLVHLDAFPRTPNGKIDRGGLPPAGTAARAPASEQPRPGLESELARLFARVLEVDAVGREEDFFLLGGHSLLAVRLVRAVEDELRHVCTLAMLLRTRTVAALAEELELGGPANEAAVTIRLAEGGEQPLFCLCGVHLYQELAEELASAFTSYGIFLPLEASLFDTGARTELSVEEMAAAYLEVIRREQPSGPYALLGFCFGATLAVEAARALRAEGEEVRHLILLDVPELGEMPTVGLRQRARRRLMRHMAALPLPLQNRLTGGRTDDRPAELERLRGRIYDGALRRYSLRPYDGGALITRAADDGLDGAPGSDPRAWWTRAFPDARVLDTPGDHISSMRRPYVSELAEAVLAHTMSAATASRSEAATDSPRAPR